MFGKYKAAYVKAAVISIILAISGMAVNERAEATTGHFMHGFGTINQTMGGAGTGLFIDSLGTIGWNPAGSVRFDGGRMDYSLEYFMPNSTLGSTAQANAFGVGFPAVSTSGTTSSEIGDSILPAFGYIWHRPGKRSAMHLGLSGVAGFGVKYPQDNTITYTPAPTPTANTNIILTPQMPAGFGFGTIQSDYRLLKIYIGHSYRFSKKFTFGYSAVPAYSQLKVSPAPFAAPDDANGDGYYTYPAALKMASSYGFGVQIGGAYDLTDSLTLGLSYATAISMADYRWNATDELGNYRLITFDMDVPAFLTTGIGWRPNKKTQIAIDFKWINYDDTHGFDRKGFNPDGSVAGFGWDDISILALGIQRQLTNKWDMRVGFNTSQDPIPGEVSFFNTPAPAEVQNRAAIGFTYNHSDDQQFHIGYYHAFEDTHSGPLWSSAGQVANTQVINSLEEDSIAIGYTFLF